MRRFEHTIILLLLALALHACDSGRERPIDPGPDGGGPADAGATASLPLLGGGTHAVSGVDLRTIATAAEGLYGPRDLAFNPSAPTELWIVNVVDSSVVVLLDAGMDAQDWLKRRGLGNTHFMPRPSAFAFGAPGTFATAPEEDEVTQPDTPEDFMGPALWPADLSVFDAGHASHLDMLHNSPNAVGIAWEQGNVYWVVDGMHGSLTRYDFGADHGYGGEDHTDGVVARYADGQIGYAPDVPSHAELDAATGLLYVADAGINRIVTLDTTSGTRGGTLGPNYDGSEQYQMLDAVLTTFVDGASAGLVRPSGLALHEGHVFVSDNETSRIVAFDLAGALVDYLDLSSETVAGSLMGIAFGQDGALYIADSAQDRVLRVAALASP